MYMDYQANDNIKIYWGGKVFCDEEEDYKYNKFVKKIYLSFSYRTHNFPFYILILVSWKNHKIGNIS